MCGFTPEGMKKEPIKTKLVLEKEQRRDGTYLKITYSTIEEVTRYFTGNFDQNLSKFVKSSKKRILTEILESERISNPTIVSSTIKECSGLEHFNDLKDITSKHIKECGPLEFYLRAEVYVPIGTYIPGHLNEAEFV